MKSRHIDIHLPDWAAEDIATKSKDLGIAPDELVRSLICSNVEGFEPRSARHFSVPASMEQRLVGDGFMVVGRTQDQVVLAPTRDVPFEEALAAFQANGLNEEQVLEILES